MNTQRCYDVDVCKYLINKAVGLVNYEHTNME